MIEFLAEVDRVAFLFVNVRLANPVTDLLMPIITSDNILRVAYAAFIAGMLIWGNARLRWFCLFSALTLLLSDQLSASVLKPLFARPRPCQDMSGLHLLVECGAAMAMPSSHAANAFGQAVLFSLFRKKLGVCLYTAATLIALSRVFVGVHYPGDILVGGLLGAACGLAVWNIFCKLSPKFHGIVDMGSDLRK